MQDIAGLVACKLQYCGEEVAKSLGIEEGDPYVLISNMAVEARFRGRGVAKRLMSEIESRAAQYFHRQRPKVYCLLVYKYNTAALR